MRWLATFTHAVRLHRFVLARLHARRAVPPVQRHSSAPAVRRLWLPSQSGTQVLSAPTRCCELARVYYGARWMSHAHCALSAGDDAFQPQTYGRTITVQRRITATGSSTWKLTDQDGRKVGATTFWIHAGLAARS